MKRRDFLRLSLLALAGCAAPPELIPGSTSTASPIPTRTKLPECQPAPLVVPTRPAFPQDVYHVDDVGLHVTAEPVDIDPATYRLRVYGLVDHALFFSLDDLRCLPKVTTKLSLTCLGVFTDTATWAGTPLKPILEMVGIQKGASSVYLIGADGYQGTITLENAQKAENFRAYQLENGPGPILHGFPVRAALPGLYGFSWTKWLVEIKVV